MELTTSSDNRSRSLIQHAGPKLVTYSDGRPTTIAIVHLAHRSRRFTIRTLSQTQKAANATPIIATAMAMPHSTSGGEGAGRAIVKAAIRVGFRSNPQPGRGMILEWTLW